MRSLIIAFSIIALDLVLVASVGAVVIDFEDVESGTLVRDQYQALGMRVTGVDSWSGLVISEGQYNVQNFGNSPTQILNIGAQGNSTTIRFVDPEDPDVVVGADLVSFIIGDGDPDSETFDITFFDTSGTVLDGPNQYTTFEDGLWIWATNSNFGAPIGYIEVMVIPASESGVTLDDLNFGLIPVPNDEMSWGQVKSIYR